MLSFVHM